MARGSGTRNEAFSWTSRRNWNIELPHVQSACLRRGFRACSKTLSPSNGQAFVRAPSPARIRSIYARNQGIQIHGLKIHRLCLNRHLPRVDRIADHSHSHSQLLMYLAGAGSQRIAGRSCVIGRGSLFFIPPRTLHSFVDTHGFKPLCLALDFEWKDEAATKSTFTTLTALDLKRIRQELAFLTRWRTGSEIAEPREAAAALRLIDVCFRALGFLSRDSLPTESNLVKKVQRTLSDPSSWGQPLTEIARRLGYQPDYLNRMLKPAAASPSASCAIPPASPPPSTCSRGMSRSRRSASRPASTIPTISRAGFAPRPAAPPPPGAPGRRTDRASRVAIP